MNLMKDYPNEFQICNSCCIDIEQKTPSGFKPNFKFEYCKRCDFYKDDYINEYGECTLCNKCKRCGIQKRDYLNGFQICNSCCIDIEQKTPSGFKPNVEHEKCRKCYQRRDYLNEFKICNLCCKKMEQMTPSGFKANYKFEECKGICGIRVICLNEFNECKE